MRYFISIFLISFFVFFKLYGDELKIHSIDSLKNELASTNIAQNKIEYFQKISDLYENSDSSLFYLEQAYQIAKQEEDKANIAEILNSFGIIYKNTGKYYIALEKLNEGLKILRDTKIENEKEIKSRLFLNLGEVYRFLADYQKSAEQYQNCLDLILQLDTSNTKIKELYGNCFNNIGLVDLYQGNYEDAIKNYQKSLKIQMEIGNVKSISNCLTNIGNVHFYQGDYDKAIEYYTVALENFEKMDYKKGIIACLTNIGSVNLYIGNKSDNKNDRSERYEQAIKYYTDALTISHNKNDNRSVSDCLGNIGVVYSKMALHSNYDSEYVKKTIEYYQKSIDIKLQIDDELGAAIAYLNISNIYNNTNQLQKSSDNLNKSLALANKIGSKKTKMEIFTSFSELYENMNDIPKAYEYYKLAIIMKDSIYNEKKSEQIAEMEERFQSEKKQLEIDKLTSEKALQAEEVKRQRILIYSFILGFIIILIFSIFLYRLFIQKKKANRKLYRQNIEINQQKEEITAQRDEIEAQRDEVTKHKDKIEEIHHELTDSIQYAKRIQEALLPTGEIIREYFDEHFILFKPHSVVSGDFYWAAKVNEYVIVAVADCTGHGVPGAFMSMLGISFLNEIVRYTHITKANEVLNELRQKVIYSLKQKGDVGEQQDGMDISLCALNMNSNILQFAGANNPLYIVKCEKLKVKDEDVIASETKQSEKDYFTNVRNDDKLVELKGDKMPIAIYVNMDDFTNHEVEVKKGDSLYLFSDGYIDQYGGKKDKRFMSKQFKSVLLENADKPMNIQKEILISTLENWIGNNSQVDDITVIGLKI